MNGAGAVGGAGAGAGEGGGGGLDDLAIYGEVVAVETVDTIRVVQYALSVVDSLFRLGTKSHL